MYEIIIDDNNTDDEVRQFVTVKALKEFLDTLDDNDIIILPTETCSGYAPMDLEPYICKYKPDDMNVYIRELNKEMIEDGYTAEDLCEEGLNAVVFFPK